MQGYNSIDQRLHQLSQTIAKVNRSFVPRKEDDSHTNLYFDAIGQRILGRWVGEEHRHMIFALNLKTFAYEWLNTHMESLFSYPIEGKRIADIESSINLDLEKLGLQSDGFLNPLHFEIPEYPFINDAFESLDSLALQDWTTHRAMANQACSDLLGYLHINGDVRIWPHHFDTGIYIEPSKTLGIGFGLAMKDTLMDEPYFYYSPYGLNNRNINYEQKPSLRLGDWILGDHWKGAVLPLSKATLPQIQFFTKEVSSWVLQRN